MKIETNVFKMNGYQRYRFRFYSWIKDAPLSICKDVLLLLMLIGVILKKFNFMRGMAYRNWQFIEHSRIDENNYKYLFGELSIDYQVRLSQGTDAESVETIKRQIIYMRAVHTKNFLFRGDYIYSDEYPEMLKSKKAIRQFSKELKIHKSNLLPEVFSYHNGLAFFEQKTIKDFLENKVAVDGGASWGDSAIVFSRYAPKEIVCFEMDPVVNVKLLNTMMKFNLNDIVRPVNLGISDITRQGELVTIDDYFVSDDVGLIKMDLEGHELNALNGSKKTIVRCRPILLISIYHSVSDFFEIKPFVESLAVEYNFMVRKLNPFRPRSESTLIAWPKELK